MFAPINILLLEAIPSNSPYCALTVFNSLNNLFIKACCLYSALDSLLEQPDKASIVLLVKTVYKIIKFEADRNY